MEITSYSVSTRGIGKPDYASGTESLPEWASIQGYDKEFRVSGGPTADLDGWMISYVVPTGKTLYITHLSMSAYGDTAEEREENNNCRCFAQDFTVGVDFGVIGGNGGGGCDFSKPIAIPGGHTFRFLVYNLSGHAAWLRGNANGYEI